MNKLLLTLEQPYPYYNHTEKLPKTTLTIFGFVFLFLYVFSPFTVTETEHKYSYPVICIIHALNAALIYFLFFLLINKLFAALIKEENWKVYKSILVISILLLFIGSGSFFIRPLIYFNPDNFSLHYFISETVNTFLVGSLVFAGFTLIDFYRLLKSNRSGALGLDQQITQHRSPAVTEQIIKIEVEDASFEINTAEFIFAKAEGNYVTFYFNKNGRIEKQLKRISLKSVEEQLKPLLPDFIRTHRAYVVQTTAIIRMTGNAQGYQLYFDHIDFPVPVSRSLIPAFKMLMNTR